MENRKRNNYNDLIYGNTAVNPQRYPSSPQIDRQKEEERKLKKLERENLNKQVKQRNNQKIKVMASIGFIGVMAFSFIFRTSQLYSYQKQYTDMQVEAREMEKDIEGFRASIIKGSSIDNVVVKAQEIGMVNPGPENYLNIDLTKNNFSESIPSEDSADKNIIEKIADTLGLI